MTTVVFDLDDTLYKERDYLASGLRAVATAVATRCGIDADRLLGVMAPAANAFDALRSFLHGRSECIPPVEQLLDIYRNHRPQITLPDGSRLVLETLKKRGYRLGLITDGRSVGQRNKIEALGLERYFEPEAIIISEEAGGDKTSDIPYRTLCGHIGSLGPNSVFVGDNAAKDFRWGNLHGALTVMLRDSDSVNIHPQSLTGPDASFALRPRMVIDNLQRLLQLLKP